MGWKEYWREYYEDPFGYFDKTYINVLGVDLLLFKYHDRLRKILWWGSVATTLLWVLMGYDSGYGQLEYAAYAIKDYFLSPSSTPFWEQVLAGWNWAYGKTMHWSAFTIYGLLYCATSWYLEDELGFTKTKNSAYSLAVVLLNIGIFEWWWMYCYAFFHDQWWSVTWKMPQLRILIQNVMFTVLGLSSLLLFWVQSHDLDEAGEIIGRFYRFRLSKAVLLLGVLTIASGALWIYYPWEIKPVETYVIGYGLWQNGNRFPQTLYTVNTNILDDVNAGAWFYVEDNLIHSVNLLVKILLALTGFFYIRSWKYEYSEIKA